MVDPGER
jgi:hypothetical protein